MMTPEIKKIFNETFRRNLDWRLEHYEDHYKRDFVRKITQKFNEFTADPSDITPERINDFVKTVDEEDGLRGHVRVGLETANKNTRIIVERWFGPL